ncbi:MAG: imidazolonepropionase-like amidohydrolase [Planctomycetota bacterium]
MRAFTQINAGQGFLALALGLFASLSLPAFSVASPFAPILEDEDEDAEEEEDKWFAVSGGDVYTGTGSLLRGATVLAKNGVIDEIGYDLEIPEEAEVIDATGHRVYPGLVAINTSGLFGGSSDIEHSVDAFSSNMTLALAGGITCAVQGNEVGKLKRGQIDGVLAKTTGLTTLTYSTRTPKTKRDLRKSFEDGADWIRNQGEWQSAVKTDKKLKEPKKPSNAISAISVLQGTTTARFSAQSSTDLLGIARFAQEFGFRPIIDGCAEGWTVADELGRAGAKAIVTPRYRRAKDETTVFDGGSSIENAAKLHAAGVSVAIIPQSKGIDMSGIVGRDIMHLMIEAGFAVRGGLSEEAALAGITIIPARMIGMDHRIGTLEVGKDCDLIVTDGDVLHYETFVQWAAVEGEVVYDKQEELYFAHIRPRPEAALAPIEKVDAGEEGAVDPDAEEGDEGEPEDHDEDESEDDD